MMHEVGVVMAVAVRTRSTGFRWCRLTPSHRVVPFLFLNVVA